MGQSQIFHNLSGTTRQLPCKESLWAFGCLFQIFRL